GDNQNLAETAVQAVGQREINDPEAATKRYSRLAAVSSQRIQSRSLASGKHDRQHIIHNHPLTSLVPATLAGPTLRSCCRSSLTKHPRYQAIVILIGRCPRIM